MLQKNTIAKNIGDCRPFQRLARKKKKKLSDELAGVLSKTKCHGNEDEGGGGGT